VSEAAGLPRWTLPAAAALVVALVLDVLTTYTVIELGGREANPLVQGVAGNAPGFGLVKGVVLVAATPLVVALASIRRWLVPAALALCAAGTAAIVTHNLRLIGEMT